MRLGAPTVLQTDNGSEFCNPPVESLMLECGIKLEDYRHGACYKTSTQGGVEGNRVLRRLLEFLCNDPAYQDVCFEDLLLQAMHWMNSYHHRSTKQSAYMYVYGRVPPSY